MAITPSTPEQSPAKALQRKVLPKVFDITERRHPRFNLMVRHWRFMLESYSGGPEYLYKGVMVNQPAGMRAGIHNANDRNLFKYFKEGQDEYQDRVMRSHRKNYSKKVVDQIRSFIARKPPVRKAESASEVLEKFWKNVDGKGRSIDRFMMIVLQWVEVFGIVWLFVDKPRGRSATFEDELQDGMPFVRAVPPYDVLDAGFDSMGKLKWILMREVRRLDDDPMLGSPEIPHFVLWTRESFKVFRKTLGGTAADRKTQPFVLVDEGAHGLGEVPFRAVRFSDTDDSFVAPGVLDDIAALDRSIYNKQSQLDTIILDQTFSQLTMPADAVILNNAVRSESNADAINSSRELTRRRVLEMGTKRTFLYNGMASHSPKYISPDASQALTIQNEIKKEIEEVYRLAGLLGEVGREVKTQTGVSKAYDFDRINKVLAFAAKELEIADQWLAKTAEQWMELGKKREIPTDLIQYPDNFDIIGLLEALEIAIRADEYDLHSPTAEAELRRQMLARLFPNATEKQLKTMMDEIETIRDREIQMHERGPLNPGDVPPGGGGQGDLEPAGTRGAGGGARPPGEGPPTRPTVNQARSAERGQPES